MGVEMERMCRGKGGFGAKEGMCAQCRLLPAVARSARQVVVNGGPQLTLVAWALHIQLPCPAPSGR